jgi:uncharacterized protein YkwD
MKKIITILLFFISSILFSQKKTDTINYHKINYKLLNSLLFEEINKVRGIHNLQKFKRDVTCGLAIDYQVNYLSQDGNEFSHNNVNKYRGVFLPKYRDRYEFFRKKTNSKNNPGFEILAYFGLQLNQRKTYEGLAKEVIDGWLNSTLHRNFILLKEHKSFTVELFMDFSTTSVIKSNEINFYFGGFESINIISSDLVFSYPKSER